MNLQRDLSEAKIMKFIDSVNVNKSAEKHLCVLDDDCGNDDSHVLSLLKPVFQGIFHAKCKKKMKNFKKIFKDKGTPLFYKKEHKNIVKLYDYLRQINYQLTVTDVQPVYERKNGCVCPQLCLKINDLWRASMVSGYIKPVLEYLEKQYCCELITENFYPYRIFNALHLVKASDVVVTNVAASTGDTLPLVEYCGFGDVVEYISVIKNLVSDFEQELDCLCKVLDYTTACKLFAGIMVSLGCGNTVVCYNYYDHRLFIPVTVSAEYVIMLRKNGFDTHQREMNVLGEFTIYQYETVAKLTSVVNAKHQEYLRSGRTDENSKLAFNGYFPEDSYRYRLTDSSARFFRTIGGLNRCLELFDQTDKPKLFLMFSRYFLDKDGNEIALSTIKTEYNKQTDDALRLLAADIKKVAEDLEETMGF